MLLVIPYRQCGETGTPIGGTSADIMLSRGEHCGHCYRSHHETRQLHFCSPACLVAFVRARPAGALEEIGRNA